MNDPHAPALPVVGEPLTTPPPAAVERLGIDHFVAAVPALHALGEGDLAGKLSNEALRFCLELAGHRRSTEYQGALRPPFDLNADALASALLAAADVLCQRGQYEAALGSWCSALAARLLAIANEPDVAVSRLLAFVNIDARGLGELVLGWVTEEDLARRSRWQDEVRR